MAILDKESRSRGLRMPSLSAIKSRKKNAESPPRRDSSSDEVVIPARMDSAPGRFLHSQEKDLPPNPLPSPPPFPSAPADSLSNQSPYHHINPTPKYEDRPLPKFPRVPVPKREEPPAPVPALVPAPAPVQQVTPPSSEDHYPIHYQEHIQPIEDPLESFIPEPEPEPGVDGTSASVEPVSSEESNGPWTPPDYEPIAAPLNQLHYACYQEHRSMPTANNLWHPLPCMTCQKYDREVRHRCVFCCLRICASCYQTLQKCPNRSLAQLMKTIPSHE
ncbi:hypothetical protein BDV35DRAFT_397548 [Aspergillus flavus]|uniref:DNA, SC103 n=3 Tax=Aspergillus subgen. Circumdati TaxID=2720871 RepID=Q2TZ05_ASPOR|nr:unnamed protein product [Aspergillus oryzae RIB40]EIT73730.1 hypothetical protein Ao3042_10582 [Aspergillus oryzae 3.042]KAB8241618.1 hypothetical protein BDV35DRAFT_397548 [Aspergillus flavus]KDE75581.1 hypothetical protein AO1008_11932 [Aspergillus oryzae 100-8]KAJ1706535.1 hypothetical protein NYO67_11321 [Aspergillus flavus]RAQ54684.1 hypothetical protein AFGD_004136 [Aspergillus flavus]|eukprot:EIT73730.1 hypothetical protein Ao3042_10582 [Aspergillus oryzae 3.042]